MNLQRFEIVWCKVRHFIVILELVPNVSPLVNDLYLSLFFFLLICFQTISPRLVATHSNFDVLVQVAQLFNNQLFI